MLFVFSSVNAESDISFLFIDTFSLLLAQHRTIFVRSSEHWRDVCRSRAEKGADFDFMQKWSVSAARHEAGGQKGALTVTSLTPTTSWRNATVRERRGNRVLTFLSDEPTWSYFCIVSRLICSCPPFQEQWLVVSKKYTAYYADCFCLFVFWHSYTTCCIGSIRSSSFQETGNQSFRPVSAQIVLAPISFHFIPLFRTEKGELFCFLYYKRDLLDKGSGWIGLESLIS